MLTKIKEFFASAVNAVKNVLWLYRPYLKYGKGFVLLSLLFWCVIVPISQLVNVYLPSAVVNMLEDGTPFLGIVVHVILLQCILMFQPMYEDVFNRLCKDKTLSHVDAEIKREVFNKAIKTDLKYIDDPAYYDNYSWTVGQYAGKAGDAQKLLNRILSSIITILSMLAVIATLSPLAVVVTVLGTAIENILFTVATRQETEMEEALAPYNRRMSYCHRIFYEGKYAADLKSTGVRHYLFRQFDKAQTGKVNIIKQYAKRMLPWSLTGNLTFYIARTFVILNIARGIYVGNIQTVGSYVTMMAAVGALNTALQEMFYYVIDVSKLSLYAKRIRAFFDIRSEIETDTEKKPQAPHGALELTLDGVGFRYENSDFSLEDVHIHAAPGEKIAIVGENGVGKSTLTKLIMRFYDTERGRILINGMPIDSYDLASLRGRIGIAFQATNIYAMSMRDNIDLHQGADEAKIRTAVEETGLGKVLQKNHADMARELTREFHADGIMLSGGEVQKIGIARLLAGDFGLLIFDEPSSALDPISEYEISEMILSGSNRTTTILIAHRLSTVRNADRIYLIDGGVVREAGTHEELMARCGKYYEMFTKQAENYVQ
ncbi:MAG: ABC transporter ATP-binding protein [Clostridia bacterium]|nr:ABC transporter ATP-binding protein [Clostridia bacterium]